MAETSRDAVLARIRQSLVQPAPLPPRPDFTAPVHAPLANSDAVVAFAESFQRVTERDSPTRWCRLEGTSDSTRHVARAP